MSLNVISNYAANIANRNVKQASAEATDQLRKLSSGKEVEAARDDAAAMAIATGLRAEVLGLKQAVTNAAQANSMLQIVDSALSRVSDMLIRMNTLAVQSSSGHLTDNDRANLNFEFTQLKSEIDRIAKTTNFNGQVILNGSGPTSGASYIPLDTATDSKLHVDEGFAEIAFLPTTPDAPYEITYGGDAGTGELGPRQLRVKSLETGASQTVNIGATAIGADETQEVDFAAMGVTITLNDDFDKDEEIDIAVNTVSITNGTGVITANTAGLNDKISITESEGRVDDITANTVAFSNFAGGNNLTLTLSADEANFVATGVDLSSTGLKTVTLERTVGERQDSITIQFTVGTLFDGNETVGAITLNQLDNTIFTGLSSSSATQSTFDFRVGTGIAGTQNDNKISVTLDAATTAQLGINNSSIDSLANADTAISEMQTAISSLNTSRSTIGAAQNRLDFARVSLEVAVENTEEARSSLVDLNMAEAISELAGKQVLLQAGLAMITRSGQMTENLLQLFR